MKRLELVRRLPPRAVAGRALDLLLRRPRDALARRRDEASSTYTGETPSGDLARLVSAVPQAALEANRDWILAAAERYARNRFDVLGSGWVEVAHGMSCAGFEGEAYPPGESVAADREGAWLEKRVTPANLAASQAAWRLVDEGYRPIDWQLDIRSGWRWDERQWAADAPIGHKPGADIKLPWELARMQHLAVLAWAFALTRDDRFRRAARNQILDFIATNPPRFGANWRGTMEVAIRGANWALAIDLFRAAGAAFDAPFLDTLKRSLVDHARHIVGHLEFYPEGRANHYLADVAGLAFIAAILPESAATNSWLAFAGREALGELMHQFLADGGSFEASTSYHRLSGEMAAFTVALLAGRDADRLRRAQPIATRPRRPWRTFSPPEPRHLHRLADIAAFTRAVTKPSGRIAQIGDNDSGRFFKLHPAFDAALDEDALDHRHLVAAIDALLGVPAPPGSLDAAVILALAEKPLKTEPKPRPTGVAPSDARLPDPAREIEIVAPGGDLRTGLTLHAFAQFGLWIWRSDRLFLALRCGRYAYDGRGAHAHNDQLAIELSIDGEDWIADPGSFTYTASRPLRNAYRSIAAHAAPRDGAREPAPLDIADFWLDDAARAQCLRFDRGEIRGRHFGFGAPVERAILLGADTITIRDAGAGIAAPEHHRCVGREETAAYFAAAVPFSPGYGKR